MASRASGREPKHSSELKPTESAAPKPIAKNLRSVPSAKLQAPGQFDPSSAQPPKNFQTSKAPVTLNPLVQGFLIPSSGEYKACENYCRPNPAVWTHPDIDKLPELAKERLRQGKDEHARRLMERWLMVAITRRKGYKAPQAIEYLKGLANNDKLRDDFETALEKAITQHFAGVDIGGRQGDDDDDQDEDDEDDEDDHKPAVETSAQRGRRESDRSSIQQPARRLSKTDQDSLSHKMTGLDLKTQADNPATSSKQKKSYQPPIQPPDTSPNAKRDAYAKVASPNQANTVAVDTIGDRPRQIEAGTDQVGPNQDFLQTYKEKDELNVTYLLREGQAAIEFFIKGRVFAMVWHENVGKSALSNSSKTTAPLDRPFHSYTTTREGIQVFSHIRRFVIVKARYGYCWAIPINSYGGRGLTSKKMSSREQQAHTIVHSIGYKAQYMKTEVHLDKKPIAVDMAPGQKPLTTASRLHFDKPQSIDWNIKVSDVGLIKGPDDMRRLVNYFNEEFNRADERD